MEAENEGLKSTESMIAPPANIGQWAPDLLESFQDRLAFLASHLIRRFPRVGVITHVLDSAERLSGFALESAFPHSIVGYSMHEVASFMTGKVRRGEYWSGIYFGHLDPPFFRLWPLARTRRTIQRQSV